MRDLTLKLRGLPVVCTLIERSQAMHGLRGHETTVPFTRSELSDRYRVSRQHVRKVLEGLERMELVALNLHAQEITLRPDLVLAGECMVASAFIMVRKALTEAVGEVDMALMARAFSADTNSNPKICAVFASDIPAERFIV